MKRNIIRIDEELCDGCGNCIISCAEGALKIVDGKAKLIAEKFCDGLGACLGDCPTGALVVEERDSDEFDEAAVEEHLEQMKENQEPKAVPTAACGCPGSAMRQLQPIDAPSGVGPGGEINAGDTQLSHWPVQLKLVPAAAPFLQGADLLICADCVPFAVPDFHQRYLKGKSVLVGCPKLDDLDAYQEKFKEIFRTAKPASVTVLRMEVPCCGGIVFAAQKARDEAAPDLPLTIETIRIRDGQGASVLVPGCADSQVAGGA